MSARAKRSQLAAIAKQERRRDYMDRLSAWDRWVMLHKRLVPGFIRRRSIRAAERAWVDAEAALPRRYRRALQPGAMRPAKEKRA